MALRILLLSIAVAIVACNRDQDATPVRAANPARRRSAIAPNALASRRIADHLRLSIRTGHAIRERNGRSGPRPLGSANHKKVEAFITSQLKGDAVEDDIFTADTPEGKFPVRNIVAKFPGTRDGIIVIASHYDTNYPLRNTSYIGANDGASSSALLLEIANQLRGKKRDGYSVLAGLDDAEEAMKPDTEIPFEKDSLYGIRHLAEKWQADGTLKKIKAFLLADNDRRCGPEHRSRMKTRRPGWKQSSTRRPRASAINLISLPATVR